MLNDLTAEVNRLRAECAALSEESHEVTFPSCLNFKVVPVIFLLSVIAVVSFLFFTNS